MAQYELTGEAPLPMSVKRPAWGVYDIFETGDGGRLFIGVVTDTQWEVFCREFDEPQLAADPRLKTNGHARQGARLADPEDRRDHASRHTQAELAAKLEAIGLPFAPIAKPWDLLDDPHLNASRRPAAIPRYGDKTHQGARPAARAGRQAPRQALRPAAHRRARAGIAGRARAVHRRKSKACATGV